MQFFQTINFDSPRGGISLVTEKGPETTSRLMIQKAVPSDSGIYRCEPSNANPSSIKVHVVNGELKFTARILSLFFLFPYASYYCRIVITPSNSHFHAARHIFLSLFLFLSLCFLWFVDANFFFQFRSSAFCGLWVNWKKKFEIWATSRCNYHCVKKTARAASHDDGRTAPKCSREVTLIDLFVNIVRAIRANLPGKLCVESARNRWLQPEVDVGRAHTEPSRIDLSSRVQLRNAADFEILFLFVSLCSSCLYETRQFEMTKRFKAWFPRGISRNFRLRPVTGRNKIKRKRIVPSIPEGRRFFSRFVRNSIYFLKRLGFAGFTSRTMSNQARVATLREA